jgi:hypothetical protein
MIQSIDSAEDGNNVQRDGRMLEKRSWFDALDMMFSLTPSNRHSSKFHRAK